MKERFFFRAFKCERILSGAIFIFLFPDSSCPCSRLICPFSVIKRGEMFVLGERQVHLECMLWMDCFFFSIGVLWVTQRREQWTGSCNGIAEVWS